MEKKRPAEGEGFFCFSVSVADLPWSSLLLLLLLLRDARGRSTDDGEKVSVSLWAVGERWGSDNTSIQIVGGRMVSHQDEVGRAESWEWFEAVKLTTRIFHCRCFVTE